QVVKIMLETPGSRGAALQLKAHRRRRLLASGDALDGPFPPKHPKMRGSTYERLRAVDAALIHSYRMTASCTLYNLVLVVLCTKWGNIKCRTNRSPSACATPSRIASAIALPK